MRTATLLPDADALHLEGLCQNSDVARIHVFSFPTRTTIFEQCGPSAPRIGRIIGINPHFSPQHPRFGRLKSEF